MALKLYDKLKHAVRFWLLRTLPACQQTVETISQSMERRLTLSERIKLKIHLWICVWCQWYVEHLQLIRDTSRAHAAGESEPATSATLSNDARERIRRRLTNNN
jgi:hypothetical protein